jgi:hypothetical protein
LDPVASWTNAWLVADAGNGALVYGTMTGARLRTSASRRAQLIVAIDAANARDARITLEAGVPETAIVQMGGWKRGHAPPLSRKAQHGRARALPDDAFEIRAEIGQWSVEEWSNCSNGLGGLIPPRRAMV